MNAYACFPDLPSPVQRYIRTLEADRAALEARAAVAARRIAELSERVRYLEEQFRLAQLKRYAPRSEKSASACSTKPSTKPKRIRAQTRGRFPCWTRVCRKRRRAHPNPRGAGARCPQNCRASGLNTIFPTHRNAARTVSA